MRSLKRKVLLSESLFLPKNKLTTGKMIDDNFRKIAVENHLEGVTKLVEGSNWEKPTKLNIAKNLAEKIAELLDAEVQYSYLLDHKGVEQRKISITYKEKNDE